MKRSPSVTFTGVRRLLITEGVSVETVTLEWTAASRGEERRDIAHQVGPGEIEEMALFPRQGRMGGVALFLTKRLAGSEGRAFHVLREEAAPGIHLVHSHGVNVYLIEDDDGLTLVDSGLPRAWSEIGRAIRAIGRTPGELRALVLTHAHFDHVGTAKRLVDRLGVPVYAHVDEVELAEHPYRYAHENPRALYPLRHPRAVPTLFSMMMGGALQVKGVRVTDHLTAGDALDVPGRPVVVGTAGHTSGHCALHLSDRDTVISGDALVTFDPYTGRSGPRIVAGAATADSALALESLTTLANTGARVLLPGHGEPWYQGAAAAAAEAWARGAS